MPRLGYSKSRTGCLKCRQRRVKCDEQKPCSACQRHGIPCSLVTDAVGLPGDASPKQPMPMAHATARTSPKAPTPRPQAATNSTMSSTPRSVSAMALAAIRSVSETAMSSSDAAASGSETGGAHSPVSTVDHHWVATSSSSVSLNVPMDGLRPADQHHLWATDMELMHHYSTTAFKTMPRAESIGNVWQTEAPLAAFQDDYMLHLILAFSAFHLAHLRPSRQSYYSYIAAYHQDLGISRMRAGLSQLSAENCHSLFMAGGLLAVGTFAALAIHAGDKTDKRPSVNDVVEVFVLLKGVGSVLHSWEPIIHCGKFSDMFKQTQPTEPPSPFWNELRTQLDLLHQPLEDLQRQQPASLDTLNMEIRKLYNLTKRSYESSSDPELRVVMAWPIDMSDAFLTALKEQEPAALVMLGFYCVVVDRCAVRNWFMQTWSREVLRQIHVMIPAHYAELLRWPLAQMSAQTP